MGGKSENKAAYFDKLENLLKEFKSIFIVTVDNVSSQQMHEIRGSLRGEGVVLMGKNTMVYTRANWTQHAPLARQSSSGASIVGCCLLFCVRSAALSKASSPITPSGNGCCHTSRVYTPPHIYQRILNLGRQRRLRLYQRRAQRYPGQDPEQQSGRSRSGWCCCPARCQSMSAWEKASQTLLAP